MARVIAHIDMDCFFAQVETLKNPSLRGQRVAVQQHQDLICVNYEARAAGIKKHDHPHEAQRRCPELVLVHVPKFFGSKVSYLDYIRCSRRVFEALESVIPKEHIEAASIDEAYLVFPFAPLQL